MAESVSGPWSYPRYLGASVIPISCINSLEGNPFEANRSVVNSSEVSGTETIVTASSECCKLIQLSDLHLQALAQQRYRDRDVEQQLLAVLGHIEQQHPDLDGLLLSGDLVHQGHSAAYRRLARYLERFDKPWYWIPGNHDSFQTMQRIRPAQPLNLRCNGWSMVLLDSTSAADGQGSGSLAESELRRLEEQLQICQKLKAALLVVLHHNPMSVQSDWQDRIMLANADRLWALLGRYKVQVTILFGHVHQQWDLTQANVRVLGCPSTAVQFVMAQEQLLVETEGAVALPGYRWLKLFSAGSNQEPNQQTNSTTANRFALETGVEWVCVD